MRILLFATAAAAAYLSVGDAFTTGGLRSYRQPVAARGSVARRSLSMSSLGMDMSPLSMDPDRASTSDVLATLDELDAVMGVDTQEEEDMEPKQAELNRVALKAAQERWAQHEYDSGSSCVQVAVLTEKIIYLTKHMQKHPKDKHSRRGLIAMVTKRRKNLNFFFRQEPKKCLEMCEALGIRYKPPSRVRGREQRYAAFRNTKSKIGEARRAEIINKEREEQRLRGIERRAAAAAAAERPS